MTSTNKTLSELLAFLGGEVVGNNQTVLRDVASLGQAGSGDLAFYEGKSANDALLNCNADVVLVSERNARFVKNTAWVVDNQRLVFARAAAILRPAENKPKGIADTAIIGKGVVIGNNVSIGDYVVIGDNAVIGDGCQIYDHVVIGKKAIIQDNTVIYPRVVLYDSVQIGKNNIIHAGAVIGADGFGFVLGGETGHEKIPQLGTVVIGDDVDIGANTAIDCGTLDNTIIANGVKIDNLVQVGHNVTIGENSIICGCVAIAGSTKIGQRCVIGGACCISGHLSIGDDAQIAGASTLNKNVPSGARLSSQLSALPVRQWQRLVILLKRQVSKKTHN